MRIFLAGATGALGTRLVPRLVDAGHHVTGMTRTQAKADALRAAGAEPVVADALDRDAVIAAVTAARPDVVVHQLTGLSGLSNMRNFDAVFATTNRFRTEGTEHLLAGARAAGATRFVAQSYTGWPYGRTGAKIQTEDDPLDADPLATMRESLAAIRKLEQLVVGATDLEGIALRYGAFYGPGTGLAPGGEQLEMVRKRRIPIVGDGAGLWSFIHIDDAAAATVAAIEGGSRGVYNVCDDEPAAARDWVPGLAAAVGAKPPRRVPRWLGRLAAGEALTMFMTEQRGASNAKAKRELGWQPAYPTWREGFPAVAAGG